MHSCFRLFVLFLLGNVGVLSPLIVCVCVWLFCSFVSCCLLQPWVGLKVLRATGETSRRTTLPGSTAAEKDWLCRRLLEQQRSMVGITKYIIWLVYIMPYSCFVRVLTYHMGPWGLDTTFLWILRKHTHTHTHARTLALTTSHPLPRFLVYVSMCLFRLLLPQNSPSLLVSSPCTLR